MDNNLSKRIFKDFCLKYDVKRDKHMNVIIIGSQKIAFSCGENEVPEIRQFYDDCQSWIYYNAKIDKFFYFTREQSKIGMMSRISCKGIISRCAYGDNDVRFMVNTWD